MRPRLQVALDLTSLEDALKIAGIVADYIDFLEAGTPLIKVEGLRSVEALKNEFPDKVVVADMKTMDTGYLEASLAFKYGADYSTVMAAADIDTIRGAIDAAREYGKGVMVDLMGVSDTGYVAEIAGLGPSFLIVHSGIDMQHRGVTPFAFLKEICTLDTGIPVGVAGGIKPENITYLKGLTIDLVIVGGYITKARDPVEAATKIREALETL